MAKLVANTYGDALFELARENEQLDAMLEEVKAVSKALAENEEMARLMNHPKIVKEEKIRIIEDIFAGRISKELIGLMRMLVEKDHYDQMDEVFTYFITQVKEFKNIGTAYIVSAVELTEKQKGAVRKRLLETTKYVEFEMHYDVDASLIGGMVIRIGDRIVDSSIKSKLYDLTRELSRVQLNVNVR